MGGCERAVDWSATDSVAALIMKHCKRGRLRSSPAAALGTDLILVFHGYQCEATLNDIGNAALNQVKDACLSGWDGAEVGEKFQLRELQGLKPDLRFKTGVCLGRETAGM